MQVDFYHLTTQSLDRVLPQIAAKVVDAGNRLLIVTADDRQRAHLDVLLWGFAPDSFLPHAQPRTVLSRSSSPMPRVAT